jgi:hypothetical protein
MDTNTTDTNTAYETFRDWTIAVVIVFGSLSVVVVLILAFMISVWFSRVMA